MSARKDKVVAEAEAYVHDNWGLTKVKSLGESLSCVLFEAVDGSGIKHIVKVIINFVSLEHSYHLDYFEREIEICNKLKHENLIEVNNGVLLPDCVILDMEHCDISLAGFVRQQRGVLTLHQLRLLAKQLTSVVYYLFMRGIASFSVNPENVFLNFHDDGTLVAKLCHFSFEVNSDIPFIGTSVYEAPEVYSRGSKSRTKYSRSIIWSLGMLYYNLFTGSFPASDIREMRRVLSDRGGFDLPPDNDPPECFRNFVRNHLFKKPTHRFSAEEALNHPFLLIDTVNVVQMACPLDMSAFMKPLVHDVTVGDVVFEKARRTMGDGLKQPHVSFSSLRSPIIWEDVAHVLNVYDKETLENLCVLSNNGSFFHSNDTVPFDSHGNLMAVFISGKNGIVVAEIKAEHQKGIDEEEVHRIQSLDHSSLSSFNELLRIVSRTLSHCNSLVKMNERICENCSLLESIRDSVMDYDRMDATIIALQQEVKNVIKDYPIVTFVPPVKEQPRKVACSLNPEMEVIKLCKDRIRAQRDLAQSKASSSFLDLSEEIACVADVFERCREFERQAQNDLDETCESLSYVMETLCSKADVLSRLFRYIRALEKILDADKELRSLFSWECFVSSADNRNTSIDESGSKPSPPYPK